MKNNNFKDTARLIGRLGNITGFGISLVTPIFLLVWGAMWLQSRFGIGDCIMAAAIFCGLISAGCTFYHFVSAEIKRARREEEEYRRRQREHSQDGGGSSEA